ncbi:hypothetical protein [Aurantiacibacter hainanensis]|uniref:hypothetical protein n=1 Tax=Aurantiacibacter hainanensis TaxID=3076114 RepID=UPI0030C7770E
MSEMVFVFLGLLTVCIFVLLLVNGHRKAVTTEHQAELEELRERIKVLEKIVTDGGLNTASQIEALREQAQHRIEGRE